MATIIDDSNIHDLVRDYLCNRNNLPEDLRNVPIGQWVVSRVKNMAYLFSHISLVSLGRQGAACLPALENFNEPLNGWNVSGVENMSFMFYGATNFNQPLDDWKVENVTNMFKMFDLTNYSQPLNDWSINDNCNVTNMVPAGYPHEIPYAGQPGRYGAPILKGGRRRRHRYTRRHKHGRSSRRRRHRRSRRHRRH